jgi:hypothetical protein
MTYSTNVIVAGVDMDVEFEFTQDVENAEEDYDDQVLTEFSDIDIISVYYGKDDWVVNLVDVLDEETLSSIEEQIMNLYD